MTTQGIPTANEAAADAISAQVDAALGFPRCDRLAGTLVSLVAVTCPCKSANAPDTACPFRTDAAANPIQTATGWAYPIADAKVIGDLTPAQQAAVVPVVESAPPVPAATAQAVAATAATEGTV